MKRIFQVLFLALIAIGYTACQPDSFREIYPAGDPQLQATMLTEEVNFGSDSITFDVTITEKETPLSTLSIKVIVGINVIANEEIRTPGLMYKDTFTYAVPFGPNMPEGEAVKVYLTATNVEGTIKNLILDQCVGHRPAIETMYVMPPTINYKPLGKGKQMTWDGEKFVAVDLGYPKSIECLLAVVGTKFGRVHWKQPVLGICIGMQLMCSHSEEGNADCLGIFDVDVKRFIPKRHEDKVPHMGWNTIAQTNSALFNGFDKDEYVYFVHSYYVPVNEYTAAVTDYIHPFSAALHKDNFYATQFHPEKSGGVGERILKNFLAL